jgi:hypothetical protein
MSSKSSVTNVITLKNRRRARLAFLAGHVQLPPAKLPRIGSRSKYDPQVEDAKRGFRQ